MEIEETEIKSCDEHVTLPAQKVVPLPFCLLVLDLAMATTQPSIIDLTVDTSSESELSSIASPESDADEICEAETISLSDASEDSIK